MFERCRYVIGAGAVLGFVVCLTTGSDAQSSYRAPRTFDGKPDLNGIWQAMGTANWNLQAHAADQGPTQFGALFSTPPGIGVVDGGDIPYKPDALKKKQQNYEKRLTDDPEIKCYLPGVPRVTYLPYPFQIVQTPANLLFAYEYAGARRVVPVGKPVTEPPVDTWMGTPFGRWEGEAFVVENVGFNGQTWLDRAGNYFSETARVVERYTRTGADTITYEATITDPAVFTRPWKVSMPLYRRVEKNMQLLEYKCPEFSEELLYGQYKKKTAGK